MTYLVDTNVLCELTKSHPSPKVVTWIDQNESDLFLPSPVIGEITKGIKLLAKGKKKVAIGQWLSAIEETFYGRILPLNADTMKTWGTYCAHWQQRGKILPFMDSLIASIALHHQMTVVTRNTNDYPDVLVFNPFA